MSICTSKSTLPASKGHISLCISSRVLKRGHRKIEVVFAEVSLLINNEMESVSSRRKYIMLKGNGTIFSVNNVTGLKTEKVEPQRYHNGKYEKLEWIHKDHS